jgi:hypothetical protein
MVFKEIIIVIIIRLYSPIRTLASPHFFLQRGFFWGFVTITFSQDWIVSPARNPQPGGPHLRIYDSQRQGGPAIPAGTGTHFSHLLRHAWVTVGLFFNPGHHTGGLRK